MDIASPYPMPGTKAEQMLAFVAANPGASQNATFRASGPTDSPTSARKALRRLVSRGLIRIETDERGYHTLYPVPA